MMEIGQVCIKTAGRDAGNICAVIDVINENYVVIEGATRRKKCNIRHLEPMMKKLEIKKNASHEEVIEQMKSAGYDVPEESSKKEKKEKSEKPIKVRHMQRAKEEKKEVKEVKKAAPKKEKKEAKKL
jgi:large subunit ribosomal protein L14e